MTARDVLELIANGYWGAYPDVELPRMKLFVKAFLAGDSRAERYAQLTDMLCAPASKRGSIPPAEVANSCVELDLIERELENEYQS